jgi:hypothetical protein
MVKHQRPSRKRSPKTFAAIEDAMRKRLLDKHGINLRKPRPRPLGELVEWH